MWLQLKRVQLIVLIMLCLFTHFHTSANAEILFEEGFNSETEPWGFEGAPWGVSGSDDMSISSQVASEGNSSVKVYLNYDTSSSLKRTELVLRKEGLKNFTIGNTYWFAFSIFLGNDFTEDTTEDMILQFHGVPDVHLSEPWRNPVVAFEIKRTKYQLLINSASAAYNKMGDYDGGAYYKDGELGSVEINKWTDWVFMIKWDYTTDYVGRVDVWKNGEKLIEHRGGNCFNDQKGPYLKFGIYKWPWSAENPPVGTRIRAWYIDNIRFGDENSSYSEMSTHNKVRIPSNPQNAAIKIVSIPSNPQNTTIP